tara:strand:- start:185 stop:475 length:291 start_codon:yes stop_codon:yes gene_type:complete
MWREINRYKIVDDEGNTEEMILERNDNGTFRIRNDFGNVNIEFDTMTGVEFLRKAFADVQDEVELDLNSLWDDLDDDFDDDSDDDDTEEDCNGELN